MRVREQLQGWNGAEGRARGRTRSQMVLCRRRRLDGRPGESTARAWARLRRERCGRLGPRRAPRSRSLGAKLAGGRRGLARHHRRGSSGPGTSLLLRSAPGFAPGSATRIRSFDAGTVRPFHPRTVGPLNSGTVGPRGTRTIQACNTRATRSRDRGTIRPLDSGPVRPGDTRPIRSCNTGAIWSRDPGTIRPLDSRTLAGVSGGSGTVASGLSTSAIHQDRPSTDTVGSESPARVADTSFALPLDR